ncbi:hypothetical protein [Endozoicomonas atrinae]|uniref:hypothetical protein n=1 Tax=Endozoicomonas atrinae TaxID=1333660 RepID=UPI000AD66636|nr:hypothetical protein [Endozoicomonas atrinae]
MKKTMLAGSIAMLLASVNAQSSQILEDTKSLLRTNGMIVQDRNMMSAYVDCLVSDAKTCENFANTSLLYSGNLFPCPVTGCTEASPGVPISPDFIFPASATWTIDLNEAMVMYGILPPDVTHFGYETLIYERSESEIPRPGDKTPLEEGENPPTPNRSNGVIVDAAAGETRNEITMNYIPNPDFGGEGEVFVHIATPNQIMAEEIKKAFIASGYPEKGINIKALSDKLYTFGNDPATADTFRIVGRFARPFKDEQAVLDWTKSNPVKLMRVTADENIGYISFPVETLLERKTGVHEKEKSGNGSYGEWLSDTKKEYGIPDKEAVVVGRDYDPQHCVETGSYCWGNNLDALYVNINDPETGKMLEIDLSSPDSQFVISGVDHVATEYAKFWNFGFYHPETGKAIATIDFDKVQLQEYEDGKKDKNKPASHAKRNLDGKMFRLAVKTDCSGVNNCYEIDPTQSAGKFKVMMRTYVNPQTGTGPDFTEVVNPEFWVYKN